MDFVDFVANLRFYNCKPPWISFSSIFEVNSRDVVYLASPYTFDPFIVQMFLAFHNGAELLITTQATKLIPERLCRKLVDQHKITILQVCACQGICYRTKLKTI